MRREKKRKKVHYGNCGLEDQARSLNKYDLSKRCRSASMNNTQQAMVCIPILEQESTTYVVSMDQVTHISRSSNNCPYATKNRESLRNHFRTRHPRSITIIQEEVLLPQCTNCGIFKKNAHTTTCKFKGMHTLC
jgi:hypothetical protein